MAITFAGCLQFKENPLDQANGGILGNIAIFLASGGSASGGTTTGSNTVRFVILGDNGKGFTSLDGTTWTDLDAAGNTNILFKKVIWTGTRWVAVGHNSSTQFEIAYHSTDGLTWNAATITTPCTGPPRTLADVVLGGTRLVAVGNAGGAAGCTQNSVDDGLTWSNGPTPAGGRPYNNVAYDGTNFYTGFANNAVTPPLVYSSDGTSALGAVGGPLTIGGGGGTSIMGDLFGSPSRVLFVGLDNGGPPALAESTLSSDAGASWPADTLPIFDSVASLVPRAVATNGSRVVAVGDDCRVDYSDNHGQDWLFNGVLPACTSVFFEDLVYDSTTAKFYASGTKSGMGEIWASSDDGLTWVQNTGGLTNTPARAIGVRP